MAIIKNNDLMKNLIQSICIVAGRRTSSRYAKDLIRSSIKALDVKYPFLKEIRIYQKESDFKSSDFCVIEGNIETVSIERLGKAIESIIRLVYDELSEESGLFFITELKENMGKEVSKAIDKTGIDLDQIQLEQHYAYERREKKKKIKQGGAKENLIGYTWEKVTSWQHEEGSKFCTLYDGEGRVLDRLNLDNIIQNYVETLSGESTKDPEKIQKDVRIFEKEYKLLELMHKQDMNADTAIKVLQVSRDELYQMIKKLSNMEMVQYVSKDTLELTDSGSNYVKSQIKQ